MVGEYAAEIRELLKPLIPVQYTENPILNILLTDKESVMKEKGISVTIKVDNVNLNFLAPMTLQLFLEIYWIMRLRLQRT